MNYFKLHHYNGTEWTEVKAVFPFSFGDYRDKRLDEAYVTFYSTVENYKTTDVFKVEIFEKKILKKTLYYICGNDEAEELPIGSGNYKHKLFLMEPTKLTEGVIGQTLTFTNDLGQMYIENSKMPVLSFDSYNQYEGPEYLSQWKVPNQTPISPGVLKIQSALGVAQENFEWLDKWAYKANVLVVSKEACLGYYSINGGELKELNSEITELNVKSGDYVEIEYKLAYITEKDSLRMEFSYLVLCTENKHPLLPYTITTMTKRVLELAEPLEHWRGNKKPKFVFDGIKYDVNGVFVFDNVDYSGQAAKYDKIRADEIALTQATLREQLKTVAGLVHCEPRLRISESDEGLIYTVYYEPYDDAKEATSLKGKKYSYKKISCSINEYCTELRSNVQNLVNAMNYGKGVLSHPFPFEYSSIRSTYINERVSESNSKALTILPIYKIIKVMCGIAEYTDDNLEKYLIEPTDITSYVCEKSDYDLKSAYNSNPIISKNYSIYYTQGERGLDGLFFRATNTDLIRPFEEYAITNILATASGATISTVRNALAKYPAGLCFQITYLPIYPAQLSHGKQKYIAGETKFAQVYNQSENLVEAHYYGENLKGAAARLGNVEQERTYILTTIDDIPELGQVLDGYSIAAIKVEMMPYYYKAVLALSKDFNRINPYVGISSNKRVYEVSEKEAYERSILYKEYIVISKSNALVSSGTFARNVTKFVEALTYGIGSADDYPPVCCVTSVFRMRNEIGKDQSGNESAPAQASIALPVVASAFGNSILFSWAYKDNYSAGEQMNYTSEDGITGFWSKDVPYGNYYGRGDFYGFNLLRKKPDKWPGNAPFNLPQIPTAYTDSDLGIQARTAVFKDSREKLSFNLEFEFKTTEDDLIIGSGAASCCWLVDTTPRVPVLKLFKEPIGKLQQTVIGMTAVKDKKENEVEVKWSVTANSSLCTIELNSDGADLPEYKSWALCFPIDESDETFTDEYGDTKTFNQQRGGEIFIAGNGLLPGNLYITIQHE